MWPLGFHVVLVFYGSIPPAQTHAKTLDSAFTYLKTDHPRLILTEVRLIELRKLAVSSFEVSEGMRFLRKKGDALLSKPLVKENSQAFLETSRDLLDRIFVLAFLSRFDDD